MTSRTYNVIEDPEINPYNYSCLIFFSQSWPYYVFLTDLELAILAMLVSSLPVFCEC